MDNFENSRINESGLSQDADAKTICLLENDPIEEIFALNLGDFLCEHLISPDFAHKIGDKVKTNFLKNIKLYLHMLYIGSFLKNFCIFYKKFKKFILKFTKNLT